MRLGAVAGLLLAAGGIAFAQWPEGPPPPSPLPKLRTSGSKVYDFVPPGWKIERRADGDIDGTGRPDTVMVIRNTDPANIVSVAGYPEAYDSNPRMLVVVLAQPNGRFRLGEQNGTLIPRLANVRQEDPFDDLKLTKRVIHVEMHEAYQGGGFEMGSKKFALRWQNGRLVMIGYDKDTTAHGSGKTLALSANYLTRKMVITAGNMADVTDRTRTFTIDRRPLATLAEIGDGLSFDPLPQ